jgi:hypothetical protein
MPDITWLDVYEGDMPKFARVGDFCPNKVCADYGKRQSKRQKNIVKSGKTSQVGNATGAKAAGARLPKLVGRCSIADVRPKTR